MQFIVYLISEEIYLFYSNIYSSSYSENNGKEFLEKIEFKELCDGALRLEDLDSVIKKMPLGKSPAQDGLTTNFYKFFWEDIKDLLFKALKECCESNSLLPTMKRALIVDYKILTSAFANRFKFRLSQVISETQSGFIKGRLIHNNIRLVLDLIDYGMMDLFCFLISIRRLILIHFKCIAVVWFWSKMY